ncbi:MAG: hypothetical protein Ct9H90mP11_07660 [Acidimicrobiales bacterium]|nr:MAG: hypothetical protein Ct9H90mP11_07660 [Acidimicrobiales bacterium]
MKQTNVEMAFSGKKVTEIVGIPLPSVGLLDSDRIDITLD